MIYLGMMLPSDKQATKLVELGEGVYSAADEDGSAFFIVSDSLWDYLSDAAIDEAYKRDSSMEEDYLFFDAYKAGILIMELEPHYENLFFMYQGAVRSMLMLLLFEKCDSYMKAAMVDIFTLRRSILSAEGYLKVPESLM